MGQSTAPLTLALSTACSPMYRVFKALSESNVTTAQAYAGDVGISRVTQALSSLIGTAVAAVPVLITGIITMAWIALTFALYITGPFKLAFATYTGKAKMAKEWAGDLVHAWASRLAYGILLSLTILIIAWMLASTMSFGLRLVWLGVILFFFWKLVQKVQELIRPGVASIGPNLAGDVQRRTVGGAKTVTRAATRSTVGMGAGVIAAGQRRRMMAADPTRGPIRRTAGTLLSPATLVAGGIRGAVLGPQDAHRRSYKTMGKAQVNAVKAANAANSSKKPAAKAGPDQRSRPNNSHRGDTEPERPYRGQPTRNGPGRRRCRPGPAPPPATYPGNPGDVTPTCRATSASARRSLARGQRRDGVPPRAPRYRAPITSRGHPRRRSGSRGRHRILIHPQDPSPNPVPSPQPPSMPMTNPPAARWSPPPPARHKGTHSK